MVLAPFPGKDGAGEDGGGHGRKRFGVGTDDEVRELLRYQGEPGSTHTGCAGLDDRRENGN